MDDAIGGGIPECQPEAPRCRVKGPRTGVEGRLNGVARAVVKPGAKNPIPRVMPQSDCAASAGAAIKRASGAKTGPNRLTGRRLKAGANGLTM